MRIEDYPPQEPLGEAGRAYHEECLELGAGIRPEREVQYGSDPYQSISVFLTDRTDAPVLVFLHGGGWTGGYKEWMHFMAPAFTEAGFAFASAGYRLAPESVFPVGYQDAQTAVAWLHAKAAELGVNPDRIFVGGHSAGGHYAALMAVRDDWQAEHSLPRDVIRGCLPISGVFDFGPDSGLSARPRFLGPEGNGAETEASPVSGISLTPPFLLAHGTADFPHLITQAERMEAALKAAGGDVERFAMEGLNHFSASYAGGEREGPWVPRALAWMNERS